MSRSSRYPAHRKDPEAGEEIRLAPYLPPGYVLDESDPGFVVLRRMDGSFLAAFVSMSATREGIRQVADEDLSMQPAHGAKIHSSSAG